jgi:molybdopterin-guanine dinucleotide biosynthesis protein MobB
MPPLLTIVGHKHAGKTTTVVRLSAELHRRGHRVMTIKHGAHTFNIDPATTDTYRHYHEGHAERVVMAAPDKFALVMRWSEELSPQAIAERYLEDADVVVCEGFKRSSLPRIEVFRRAVHDAPLYRKDDPSSRHYLGIVTDDDALEADVPLVSLANPRWLEELASLVEREVIRTVARE